MAQLTWDTDGRRFYETGTKHGILFVKEGGNYQTGVAWNGLSGVSENPSGADENAIYADDMKYLSLRAVEIEEGSISAYTYPDEWGVCDGSVSVENKLVVHQQVRKPFGLVWETVLGNDTDFDGFATKLHLIYNATASPSQKEYATINDSPEAIEFSWDYSCTSEDPDSEDGNLRPTASFEIASKVFNNTLGVYEDNPLYTTVWEIVSGIMGNPTLPSMQNLVGLAKGTVTAAAGQNGVIEFSPVAYTYTAATVTTGDSVEANTYYERSGTGTTSDPYVYTLTEDTTFQSGKTYYTRA